MTIFFLMQILELNLVYETSKGRNQDPPSPHPLYFKNVTCSFATKTVLETLILPVAINLYGVVELVFQEELSIRKCCPPIYSPEQLSRFSLDQLLKTQKNPAGRIFEFFPQDILKTIF